MLINIVEISPGTAGASAFNFEKAHDVDSGDRGEL